MEHTRNKHIPAFKTKVVLAANLEKETLLHPLTGLSPS